MDTPAHFVAIKITSLFPNHSMLLRTANSTYTLCISLASVFISSSLIRRFHSKGHSNNEQDDVTGMRQTLEHSEEDGGVNKIKNWNLDKK